MELKVIKSFNGKEEGKTLCPGDVIQSDDVERINALVGRGFCVIVSLDDTTSNAPMPVDLIADSYVEFRDKRYHIETVKVALSVIGVRVAHNAKERAVNNTIAALTDEQAEALAEALNDNGIAGTETEND